MLEKLKSLSLTKQVLSGIIMGIIVGLIVGERMQSIAFIGTMWINGLMIGVVPMIFVMLIMSIASQEEDLKTLGKAFVLLHIIL